MTLPSHWVDELAESLDGSSVLAVYLGGSRSRGDDDPWSDVDLHRIVEPGTAEVSPFYLDGVLVAPCDEDRETVYRRMRDPGDAPYLVYGLRHALPLIDRDGLVIRAKDAADRFDWSDMSPTPSEWISRTMTIALQEAHKLRGALDTGDAEKAFDPLGGLLARCIESMIVSRRLLVSSPNRMVTVPSEALGVGHSWSKLARLATGLEGTTTALQRIEAGLSFYFTTVDLVDGDLDSATRYLLVEGVARLRATRRSPPYP